jgi:hypothetical protein
MYLYAALAFKVWMAVDCVQRGAERYWLWIVIVVPFGDWVYFFAVKAQDFRGLLSFKPRRRELDQLRRQFRSTPSQQNALALADALAEAGEQREAAEQYRGVLAQDPASKAARLGLARALRDQTDFEKALAEYQSLLELDAKYADHAAALEHAELCWDMGDRQQAIARLEALAGSSRRMDHQIALAEHLVDAGLAARAKAVLSSALDAHEDSPDYVKRRHRVAAREAQRLLRELR